MDTNLLARANEKCELCTSTNEIDALHVSPFNDDDIAHQIAVCKKCFDQLTQKETIDFNHWRCLNESIWSEVNAVKVVAHRMLKAMPSQEWAQDLLGMMYLDEETIDWANHIEDAELIHKDSNGNILTAGDTVTLIQDLNVKGAGFTAKRGTAVRRIRLVADNAEHIEGKIEGQHIVILTKYIKKSN